MIFCKQLDPTSLTAFIVNAVSGAAFSGSISSYFLSSGWAGPNVVATTGGAQTISGVKTMVNPLFVVYSGGTGAAPSTQWVLDTLTAFSGFANTFFVNQGPVDEIISGLKTFTGSVTVNSPTQTGHAVNLAFLSGASGSLLISSTSISGVLNTSIIGVSNASSVSISALSGFTIGVSGALQTLINAGGGGGGAQGSGIFIQLTGDQLISGIKTFTGSPQVPAPTLPSGVVNYATLSGVSGVLSAGNSAGLSGYVEGNFVHRTQITELISGVKTFTGAVGVGSPVLTGDAVNLGYLTGVSGVLRAGGGSVTNTYFITGTGVVIAPSIASGNISNTFNVTSGTLNVTNSGAATNTYNVSGNLVNNTNINGVTGNFVNASFYLDEFNLVTGLNLVETIFGRSFTATGYGLGVVQTGTQGFLSGSFYQRTSTNVKTNFLNFSLNSGQFFYASGGYNQTISGLNRVGLDVYQIGTGITGLSVALFGVGY